MLILFLYNLTTIVSVNDIKPYQTTPTAVFDSSRKVMVEVERNDENLLIYQFESSTMSSWEKGRKNIYDNFTYTDDFYQMVAFDDSGIGIRKAC